MTADQIRALAQSDTPTAREIVEHFIKTGNKPTDYFGLMHLASDGALAGAVTRLLDDGILERCPDEKRAVMLVRLKGYDGSNFA